MWGYRLEKADRHIALTWPLEVIRKRITAESRTIAATGNMGYINPVMFEKEVKHAGQMARALGWDMTFVKEPEVFSLPVPDSEMAYGFIITQATSGARYVVSPVPLQYLEDAVDWDAKINDEEVARIRGTLTGEVELEKPPVEVGNWKRSRAGNMYTDINGTNVTIIKANNGRGFKAVIPIHADKSKSIYTRSFPTEIEAARHVVEEFNTLIDALRREPASTAGPLAGVDWGDDPDDVPF